MSRDLSKTSRRINESLSKIENIVDRELVGIYAEALNDVRSTLSRLYEQYNVSGELSRAQLTQFVRLSGIEQEILRVVDPYLSRSITELETAMRVSLDQSYFRSAWAIDQASGVELNWGALDDRQIRAAVGIIDDAQAVAGLIGANEASRHAKLLNDALTNYVGDSRKWIGKAVTSGVIKGESIQKVARGIRGALDMSYNSAMRIARTETLRALSVGTRWAYETAEEQGVQVNIIWDATLDSRTRPEHATLDGTVREGEFFNTEVGKVRGPHESGVASFDINCRCNLRSEVEGFSPTVRRVRDEGIVPYKTMTEWLTQNGATANRYGQKYINL